MKEKVTAIIVARMDSSRLPGKALEDIGGQPMIGRIIDRVGHSRSVDEILIATTTLSTDDALEAYAQSAGVRYYRGSSDDVLGRITNAARYANGEIILDLMGDNPLVHAELVDDVVAWYRENDYDFVSSVTTEFPHAPKDMPKFPIGLRVQAMSIDCLEKCEKIAHSDEHREHATKYIFDHPDKFRVGYYPADGKWAKLNRPDLTFAVNFRENLEMIRKIYQIGTAKEGDLTMDRIVEIFDQNPELARLMGNGFL